MADTDDRTKAQTDAELVRRVHTGDTEAYAALVDRYRDTVYGLAYHHLGNREDAQDVAQQAFVHAYQHLSQLQDEAKFGPWLRRIATNQCRLWQRARQRERRQAPVGEWPVTLSRAPVEQAEVRLAVEQALSCLSPASRLTLRLFYLGSCSLQEIAAFLEVPVTTVKSRLRNARTRLRKEMWEMIEDNVPPGPLPAAFTREVLQMLDGGTVLSVAFSPDGEMLASGSKDKMVKVWDACSGPLRLALSGHGRAVDEVAFSPDGGTIASASRDRTLRLWDARTGDLRWTRTDHGRPYSLTFSSDGALLLNASALLDVDYRVVSSRAVLRDTRTGHLVRELEVLPWNTARESLPEGFRPRRGMVYGAAFSPDGKAVATGNSVVEGEGAIAGGEVKVWDARTGELVRAIAVPGLMVKSVAFSPDGRTLAGGCSQLVSDKEEGAGGYRARASCVKLWRTSDGRELATLAEEEFCAVQRVAFSPNAKYLAVLRLKAGVNEAQIFDAQSGALLQSFAPPEGSHGSLAFSPSGVALADAVGDRIIVWQVGADTQAAPSRRKDPGDVGPSHQAE